MANAEEVERLGLALFNLLSQLVILRELVLVGNKGRQNWLIVFGETRVVLYCSTESGSIELEFGSYFAPLVHGRKDSPAIFYFRKYKNGQEVFRLDKTWTLTADLAQTVLVGAIDWLDKNRDGSILVQPSQFGLKASRYQFGLKASR